uniref:polycomb group RING finger protein 1 isoform X2 n=1 Tax=Ciona intestinalis TaxID=7719 RepID=UPI000EF44658|nr:polycomb group RING finger protein 1 isoform X2 [Ciona intestinalis]|eukprot:XP_026693644.1 polycomb group RING finger protein 1 isoform X2 [Ciona intestinalis]
MDDSEAAKGPELDDISFPNLVDFLQLYSIPANESRFFTRSQVFIAYRAYVSRVNAGAVVTMDYIKFGKHLRKLAENLAIRTKSLGKIVYYELKVPEMKENERQPNAVEAKPNDDEIKIKLADLNIHISCKICCGYLVDATTITECLHSFCKSCITKHLAVYLTCPICDVKLQNANIYSSVKADIVLQDIVDKLLPGIQTMENRNFLEFHKNPDSDLQTKLIYCPYKMVTVYFDWVGPQLCSTPAEDLESNFIRTSSKATVGHFGQFVLDKLGKTSEKHEVHIKCGGVTLPNLFTIEMLYKNELDFETKTYLGCRKHQGCERTFDFHQ